MQGRNNPLPVRSCSKSPTTPTNKIYQIKTTSKASLKNWSRIKNRNGCSRTYWKNTITGERTSNCSWATTNSSAISPIFWPVLRDKSRRNYSHSSSPTSSFWPHSKKQHLSKIPMSPHPPMLSPNCGINWSPVGRPWESLSSLPQPYSIWRDRMTIAPKNMRTCGRSIRS